MRRRLTAAVVSRARPAASSNLEEGVNPANIVWIFCVARSGSTWLAEMMGDLRGHKVWKEPRVGHLFGEFYVNTPKEKTLSANFIMGEPTRDGWISAIRNFVLTGARHTFPFLGPENYLVVKEPGWCGGAVPDGGSAREPHDPPGARPPRRGGVFPGRNEEGELAGWGGGSGGRSLSG